MFQLERDPYLMPFPQFSHPPSPPGSRPGRLLLGGFGLVCLLCAALAGPSAVAAQETPYFVTYSHHLEEPGNLEIEMNSVFGVQHAGNDYIAPWVEFEYGAKAWWTTEFYLDWQGTFNDSALFTGFRWENRFRPLLREHWINPVLYVEYENITAADKTMLEVVGFDNQADYAIPNSQAQMDHQHELETKLILSSDYKGWNISENFIAEKNLGHDPWEFGYAVGASRPLRLAVTPDPCNFCRENFLLGAELYGGLGTSWNFTQTGTSQYLAPVAAWQLPNGVSFRISPGFGLNSNSHPFILRWSVSYEIDGFGHKLRSLFR